MPGLADDFPREDNRCPDTSRHLEGEPMRVRHPVSSAASRPVTGRPEKEGEAIGGSGGLRQTRQSETVAGAIGDAEDGNIHVRLIALENVIVAILASAPENVSELVREMAAYISPRPGATPHRLSVEAARNMLALVERAGHYKIAKD